MRFLLLFILLSTSVSAAIFGVDDRISIKKGSPGTELARSTAVAVLSSNIEETAGSYFRLLVNQSNEFLCPNQRFARQSSLSYACTGFLVAPNLIATAGHCMVNTGESRNETETYCKAFSWLFDYTEDLNTERVPKKNLYQCKRVIYAVKDEKAPFRDYALVELTRPVVGRKILKLGNKISSSDRFTMIGHPLGLPAKLSRNARVLVNNSKRESFLTNLDAFEGNSGSPVFNQHEEVVGILVGGTPSRSRISNGRCEIYNTCSENGKNCRLQDENPEKTFPGYQGVGSEVQRIAPVLNMLFP